MATIPASTASTDTYRVLVITPDDVDATRLLAEAKKLVSPFRQDQCFTMTLSQLRTTLDTHRDTFPAYVTALDKLPALDSVATVAVLCQQPPPASGFAVSYATCRAHENPSFGLANTMLQKLLVNSSIDVPKGEKWRFGSFE